MKYAVIILIFAAFGFIAGIFIYFADYKLNKNRDRAQKDKNHPEEDK